MKALLATSLLTLLTLLAQAQVPSASYAALPKDSASQKVIYTAVVQVPGISKGELFNRAQEWAARTLTNSKVANRRIC